MRKRKCMEIYDLMRNKHMKLCEIKDNEGNTRTTEYLWCSSAREIETELEKIALSGGITWEEKLYIFGMVCTNALVFAKGDFFR